MRFPNRAYLSAELRYRRPFETRTETCLFPPCQTARLKCLRRRWKLDCESTTLEYHPAPANL